MATVVSTENSGVKIAVGAVVCKDCELIGDIFIGSKTVVHTKARIIAEAGPIIIGENNLIEEQAQIINRLSTDGNTQPDGTRMTIGNNNVFEVGSVSEALKIGDDNILESKARVGHMTELTNGCVIGAKCHVTTQEIIPENTIIYGEKHHRRQQVCRPTAQTLQLDFLTRILPNYHYIRKPNVKAVKTEPEKGAIDILSNTYISVSEKLAGCLPTSP